MDKCESWRNHFENNYENKFDEYYRLWRGIFSAEDRTRDSERSQIISPALQQAVESSVAEIEEATFGRGRFFDIKDDLRDGEPQDVVYLREQLFHDFQKTKVRKGVAECRNRAGRRKRNEASIPTDNGRANAGRRRKHIR
jgi:hypothetical protein